jgi:hypothetical protein
MNEKEVAEGKVLFLRSLDGICPDIPLQRNKETVVGRRAGYGFEINHLADFRCNFFQCCGSGSGIRCLFDPLDPGSGMGKKSGSGSVIQDSNPDHIS